MTVDQIRNSRAWRWFTRQSDRAINWITDSGWRAITFSILFVILVLYIYGFVLGAFFQPAGASGGTVVVALHGGGGSGDRLCESLGWEGRGFDVICPQGEGSQWNSGWEKSDATRDDLTYLMGLTADYDRVLVMGYSQGAMMALRWSCVDARVERVLAKSGALPRGVDCPLAGEALVLRWHGQDDTVVPVGGDSTLLSTEQERTLRGGCTAVKKWIVQFDLDGVLNRGCGFHSRVLVGWGHGTPEGFGEWGWAWLTR